METDSTESTAENSAANNTANNTGNSSTNNTAASPVTEEEWQTWVKEFERQHKAIKAMSEDVYPDDFTGTRFDASQKRIIKALVIITGKMVEKVKAPLPIVRRKEKSQTIVLSNLKSEVPIFDPATMSGETFLRKVQRFFRMKGISEEHWLDVVALMLKGDQELWFEWKQETLITWDDFYIEFLNKFDTEELKTARRTALYTRKQKITEPFETFAFEMANLYQQVHPNAEEEQIASHVREMLYPEIRHELMNIYPITMDNLISQGNAALMSLKMMESVRGFKTSRLPPVGGSSHFKGCTCSQCKLEKEQTEKPKNVETSGSSSGQSNSAVRKDFQSYGNQRGNGSANRGGHNSRFSRGGYKNGNNSGAPKPVNDKCYLCDKRGHIARNCPDKGRVLSVMKILSSTEDLTKLADISQNLTASGSQTQMANNSKNE